MVNWKRENGRGPVEQRFHISDLKFEIGMTAAITHKQKIRKSKTPAGSRRDEDSRHERNFVARVN